MANDDEEKFVTQRQRKEFWRLFKEEPPSDLPEGEAGRRIRQGQEQEKAKKK